MLVHLLFKKNVNIFCDVLCDKDKLFGKYISTLFGK
jgi:hypothetical protein